MSCIAILRVPSESSDRDPSSKAIQNLINISGEIFDNVLVFEEQFDETDATVRHIPRETALNPILGGLFLLYYQFRVTAKLYRNRDELDAVFLHAGGFLFIFPIIYCKLDGIMTVVSVIGEPYKGYESVSSGSLTEKVTTRTVFYAEKFAYAMADGIAVFSDDMLTYDPLSSHQSKCKRVRFNYELVPDDVPDVDVRSTSIIYLGRICELKGSDRVFNTVKQLAIEIDQDVTASFVGDGILFDQLRQRRDEEGLGGVEFTGWVNADTVDEILRDSKILLLPSRSEGLPKALLEAMTRGVVPVVTPVGNMPSIVEDGVNGVLLDEPSPEYIAETIAELLGSSRLSAMSDNARETIREEYSYETAIDEFKDLLQECTT